MLVAFVTDPAHTVPAAAALVAAELLMIAGNGDVYSEEELNSWLQETGWRTLELTPLGRVRLLVAEAS